MTKEKKIFQLNKKEICITSSQIKQAIDLLVNENEILRDEIYKYKEVLDKIKELMIEYKYTNIEDYSKIMEFYRKLERLLEEVNE